MAACRRSWLGLVLILARAARTDALARAARADAVAKAAGADVVLALAKAARTEARQARGGSWRLQPRKPPPAEVRRPAGFDLSGGAVWISSPKEEEHSWSYGKTSTRAIAYHALGSLGARLPAPILSPIIAAFIRELVRLELSPLELYKVLLGELDVEEVVQMRKGGSADVRGGGQVGRILQNMKEAVLIVDQEAEDLVLRADADGDSELTLRELARMLGVERAFDSVLSSMGGFVVLRSSEGGDVGPGETLRTFVMTPFLIGLERAIMAVKRATYDASRELLALDADSDGLITLDEVLRSGLSARLIPPALLNLLRPIVVTSTTRVNPLVALVAILIDSARRAADAARRSSRAFSRSYGMVPALEALSRVFGGARAGPSGGAQAAEAERDEPSPARRAAPHDAAGGLHRGSAAGHAAPKSEQHAAQRGWRRRPRAAAVRRRDDVEDAAAEAELLSDR